MYDAYEVRRHYEHAKERHPEFAQLLTLGHGSGVDAGELKLRLEEDERRGVPLCADDVLSAELAEIYAAADAGDVDQFRYEVYDAVAVLLRMLDKEEDFCGRSDKEV